MQVTRDCSTCNAGCYCIKTFICCRLYCCIRGAGMLIGGIAQATQLQHWGSHIEAWCPTGDVLGSCRLREAGISSVSAFF